LVNGNDYERFKTTFRAYDIRGIFNEDLNPQSHFRIGLAWGTFLQSEQALHTKKDFIFIAYDIRKTSSLLAHAFAAGVMATGINVEYSGEPLQFGACMFTAWKRKAFAIAFITASHLPPEWNGVKFYYGSGVGFSEEDNMRIRDIFLEGKFMNADWKDVGQIAIINLKQEYQE
jgi:phosphomannomutase